MFCTKCKHYLDISRVPTADKSSSDIIITDVSKMFDYVNSDDTEQHYIITFNVDVLKKHPKYTKANATNKKNILDFYEKFKKEDISMYKKVYFVCNKCGYQITIHPGTVLFSQDIERNNLLLTNEDYSLMLNDPTLPRTKDYICVNTNCISHDKKKFKDKEAVLIRDPKTYRLTYVCNICHTNWTL